MAAKRSAFVPQRSSTPGFLLIHVARSLVGKMCRDLFYMFFIPPTGEESALDSAEQAAPPGVVHVDAAAP